MKILLLDIETAPNVAYVWGLFEQNISSNQVQQTSYTQCWSAKWLGHKDVEFSAIWQDGEKKMLKRMWKLMNEADVIVHYNGKKFDVPTLNKEFVKNGMSPPSSARHIDLYQVVKRTFRFASNKLDFVCKELGLGSKVKHKGFELWVECMNGNERSQQKMERYNKGDVRLLQRLYKHLRPWIKNHPNASAYSQGGLRCPHCASTRLQKRGVTPPTAYGTRYQRYVCVKCGAWSRSRVVVARAKTLTVGA